MHSITEGAAFQRLLNILLYLYFPKCFRVVRAKKAREIIIYVPPEIYNYCLPQSHLYMQGQTKGLVAKVTRQFFVDILNLTNLFV